MKQHRFFAQSYRDALKDYEFSCKNKKGDRWDWIVLTAANENQARAYQLQIEKRAAEKRLPLGTKVIVVADYKEQRIGSGGATLNVIRVILEEIGYKELLDKKILVIHSGGDSKRIPQYSACGKLFSPVPRMLPGNHISTIFDEMIIAASGIPNRAGKGIMIFPGDTELLFNPLQLDLLSCDAAGLSVKASVEEGKEHGVFLCNMLDTGKRSENVSRFLHKQSEEILRSCGAVDSSDQVDIDTGCIWLGKRVVGALIDLISASNQIDINKFEHFVNGEVCLNFYADFVYPLAEDGSIEEFYQEMPENGFSDELKQCRTELWNALHPYKLSLIRMVPARYIHFGMTHEFFDLFSRNIEEYAYLDWKRQLITNAKTGSVYNSILSDQVRMTNHVFIENSIIEGTVNIGDGSILSNVDVLNCDVPENVVMHGLELKDGRFVCRIFGREDNPKGSKCETYLNGSVFRLIDYTGVSDREIWGDMPETIWNACIFPACPTMGEAVAWALDIYDIVTGNISDDKILNEKIAEWRQMDRFSLSSSFNHADVEKIILRQDDIKYKVEMYLFVSALTAGQDMNFAISKLNLVDVKRFVKDLIEKAYSESFPNNMRIYLAGAEICRKYEIWEETVNHEFLEDKAYETVKNVITEETFLRFGMDDKKAVFVQNEVIVELPVRVNFCGSPSDAAPYCLEHGGTMLDGTLLLKGKKPIKVTVSKIMEAGIRFSSKDQGIEKLFTDMSEVINCGDPFDPFALHKAVLVATGILPYRKSELTMVEFCKLLGGGISLDTSVDVPKGSGLGTSSIIAAAAVKAINLIMGIDVTDEMVYAQVFLAEQLMATGGGWQDQVGGLTPGIKYFSTLPGNYQKIRVEHLELSDKAMTELNERFALIFSGQRRLARNVLREEMNQCIRNDAKSLAAVREIQEFCAIMRYYLLKEDVTSFARYITRQFELVKVLDKGASNTCIEYIFDVCEDLIDGKSICGAGGGGFLQVILKKGVTKKQLEDRINEVFIDCGVEVWDCQLI